MFGLSDKRICQFTGVGDEKETIDLMDESPTVDKTLLPNPELRVTNSYDAADQDHTFSMLAGEDLPEEDSDDEDYLPSEDPELKFFSAKRRRKMTDNHPAESQHNLPHSDTHNLFLQVAC